MPWMWRNFRNIFLNGRSRILLRLNHTALLYQFFYVLVDVDPEYKILPGRTALKTLDPMVLCTVFLCSSSLLESFSKIVQINLARFSFFKRCSYSFYSDTILNIEVVSNETNADVCMYIEEFILIEIWIHCCTKLK